MHLHVCAGDALDLKPQLRKPLLVAFGQVTTRLLSRITRCQWLQLNRAYNWQHLLALLQRHRELLLEELHAANVRHVICREVGNCIFSL